jgi:hypothetical protein
MSLPIYSQAEASRLGFRALTIPICPRTEKYIIDSIETTIGPVGGAWIDVGNRKLEAARKHIKALGRRREGDCAP